MKCPPKDPAQSSVVFFTVLMAGGGHRWRDSTPTMVVVDATMVVGGVVQVVQVGGEDQTAVVPRGGGVEVVGAGDPI